MILTNSIHNVISFCFYGSNLLIVDGEGNVFSRNKRLTNVAFPVEICAFHNKFYLNNLEGDAFIINSKKIENCINKTAFFKVNESYLGKQELSDGKLLESLVSALGETKFQIGFSKFSIHNAVSKDTYILIETPQTIKAFTISKSESKWSLDISEIGYFEHPFENLRNQVEVQQFIGIYEDVLWVFLCNRTFLGIDIHKGELVYKITEIPDEAHINQDFYSALEPHQLRIIHNVKWFLDSTQGKIKALTHHSYIEIDLPKSKPEYVKPKNSF